MPIMFKTQPTTLQNHSQIYPMKRMAQPYHSINTDFHKRVCYLETEGA